MSRCVTARIAAWVLLACVAGCEGPGASRTSKRVIAERALADVEAMGEPNDSRVRQAKAAAAGHADRPGDFAASFISAMNREDGPSATSRSASKRSTGADLPAWEELRSSDLINDGRYGENLRLLLEEQRFQVIGEPTLEFDDCVALGDGSSWCCTGTLIAPRLVLTAAHCVDDCGLAGGAVLFGSRVDQGSATKVPITGVVRHAKYSSSDFGHDIALVFLAGDAPTHAIPRMLAPTEVVDGARVVRIVGFGYADEFASWGKGVKREVDVPMVSPACEGERDVRCFGCFESREFVAGEPAADGDSCRGDSGGPAYVLDEISDVWQLGGVTSRATKNSTRVCGDGGVYVRVDYYVDWIVETARKHGVQYP